MFYIAYRIECSDYNRLVLHMWGLAMYQLYGWHIYRESYPSGNTIPSPLLQTEECIFETLLLSRFQFLFMPNFNANSLAKLCMYSYPPGNIAICTHYIGIHHHANCILYSTFLNSLISSQSFICPTSIHVECGAIYITWHYLFHQGIPSRNAYLCAHM